MKNTIINSETKEWVNHVLLDDDWTGAEGEWQLPEGHEFVNGVGSTGSIWNGSSFDVPDPIEEEQNDLPLPDIVKASNTEKFLIAIRVKRDSLLAASDWTQGDDSPLTDEAKTSWATYRQELRDMPETYTADPDAVVWPDAPE